jgi:hypothetical protein
MSADAIDDKIIDRIKKLMALGENNPNEHEAKIAMERAHRLLAKYNLSLADLPQDKLDRDDPYVRMDERYGAMKGPVAGRVIAAAIAKLYFCKMFYVHLGNKGDLYSFVGRTTNVEIAKTVSRYVISALHGEAMANRHVPGYATNFMIAASRRVHARCEELIKQAEEGNLKDEGTTTNLPALRATYLAELQRTDDFMKQALKIKLREKGGAGWRGGNGLSGFAEGRAAGDRVSLRPGVTGGGSGRSAIGRRS